VAEYLLNLIFCIRKILSPAILWLVYKKTPNLLGTATNSQVSKNNFGNLKGSGEFIKLHLDLREEAVELG
jgi:hypothetical protein